MTKDTDHTIVAPPVDYWKQTIEGTKGAQLERMKTVRIFNPLHVLGNRISVSDIDGLKIFKFYEHPEIRAQIEGMKTEVMKYQLTPSSHSRKGRIARGRTHSTYVICGSKTVQHRTRIRVRVACSADQLTQLFPT